MAVGLKCPVCTGELEVEEIRRCSACDTPVHVACGEEIGGCARYACPEAASARKRLLEFVRLRVDQEHAVARALVMVFGGWVALCCVAGVLTILFPMVRTGRIWLQAVCTQGFTVAGASLAWITGLSGVLPPNSLSLKVLGFAFPVFVLVLASARRNRLRRVLAAVTAGGLSERAQVVLLRHYAPRSRDTAVLAGPTAEAARIGALILFFATSACCARYALIAARKPLDLLLLAYAGSFLVVGVGLRRAASALEGGALRTAGARRLLALWRPELEEILGATAAAAATEMVVDDVALAKRAKSAVHEKAG